MKESVDPSEHSVGGTVVVTAIFPALDNACVVTMGDDLSSNANQRSNGTHEELKSNCLSPSNVLLSVSETPSWQEAPGMPGASDDNAQANS